MESSTNFVNKSWKCIQRVPEGCKKSDINLIFKKGDKKKVGNYRPINLINAMTKIFSSVIKNKITGCLDVHQQREQADFRRGYLTIDHICTYHELTEKLNEYQRNLTLILIHFSRAFDWLDRNFI